jgi:glyoxylase-like metal-dependent hydrolase (beta-lactamase superfamily II)
MPIQHFFDPETSSLSYVVFDPTSRDAVVIDPVLDYDPAGARTSTRSVEQVAAFLVERQLRLHLIIETHAHADHLSAAQYLRKRFAAQICIGSGIATVQQTFAPLFDLGPEFATDGSQFDRLLHDGERYQAGSLQLTGISTPGHTPGCMSHRLLAESPDDEALFVGDTLFIEDYGTGRCDFPGGDPTTLYQSVTEKLYRLPPALPVLVGHDYQPGGRPLRWQSTIGIEREQNLHLRADTELEAFVHFRRCRDATLSAPRLLYPSVQVNINAGRLPTAAANGTRYLRVPLNLGRPTGPDGAGE